MSLTNYADIDRKPVKVPHTLITLLVFLVSPFLALPLILLNVYNGERGGLFLLSSFMGILTYLLLPDWTLDLARYYQNFENVEHADFDIFREYLSTRSDHIYYILFFIFSKLGLKFQILLFCLSTFNFYVLFYIFDKLSGDKYRSRKQYFASFIFYFLSISILYYLSATRNALACSFFMLFGYYYFFRNKKKTGLIFLFVSIVTHISLLLYVPFLFLVSLIKNKKVIIAVSVLILLLMSAIPVERILSVLSIVQPGFANKADIYLELLRDGNWSLKLSHGVVIIASITFLLLFWKKMSVAYLNMFIPLILVVIFTIPFGFVVYDRYTFALKPFLALGIIGCSLSVHNALNKKSLFVLKSIVFGSFLLYFAYSFYLYRNNMAPYFSKDNWLLINILSKTYNVKDILVL